MILSTSKEAGGPGNGKASGSLEAAEASGISVLAAQLPPERGSFWHRSRAPDSPNRAWAVSGAEGAETAERTDRCDRLRFTNTLVHYGLHEAVALFGGDAAKLSRCLTIMHPQLAGGDIEKIAGAVSVCAGHSPEFHDLHPYFVRRLPLPELEARPIPGMHDFQVVIRGVASGALFVQAAGAAICRAAVVDERFELSMPLPPRAMARSVILYSFKPNERVRSEYQTLTFPQDRDPQLPLLPFAEFMAARAGELEGWTRLQRQALWAAVLEEAQRFGDAVALERMIEASQSRLLSAVLKRIRSATKSR